MATKYLRTDSEKCKVIEHALQLVMAEYWCLLEEDLVGVSSVEKSSLAHVQISFRTETVEVLAAARATARQIIAQSFLSCQLRQSCHDQVSSVIDLSADFDQIAQNVKQFGDEDVILWRTTDTLKTSESFQNYLTNLNCQVDFLNSNCKICEIEMTLEGFATEWIGDVRRVFVRDFVANEGKVVGIRFHMETYDHINRKDQVLIAYEKWIEAISSEDYEFFDGDLESDPSIGVLDSPTPEKFEVWRIKDFIHTRKRTAERSCFNDGPESGKESKCKAEIEKNLEKVFVRSMSDECFVKKYEIKVAEKTTEDIYCLNAECKPICKEECHAYPGQLPDGQPDEFYRAEYDLVIELRSDNLEDENLLRKRILSKFCIKIFQGA